MGHTCEAMGERIASLCALADEAPSALVPQAERLLAGARVLVVQGDPVLSDALVQQLRALGCAVGVTDGDGRGMSRLGFLDPHVVLFDRGDAGPDAPVLERLAAHPRLRWATVTDDFRWESTWPPGAPAPDLATLAERVAPWTKTDRQLRAQGASSRRVAAPLAQIGPARVLRALSGASEDVLRLTVRAAEAQATVELCGELVVGATFRDHPGGPLLTGLPALARVIGLSGGEGEIVRDELATAMNLMSPVDVALDAAETALEPPPRAATANDAHPSFRLDDEEVTAKATSWAQASARGRVSGGDAGPGAEDDTTQRLPVAEGALERRSSSSDPSAPEATSASSPVSASCAPPAAREPTFDEPTTPAVAAPLAAWDATASTPPRPPSRPLPDADAAGAHPAVQVEASSVKAAWIGAGVLLVVAALVGGALASQGDGPKSGPSGAVGATDTEDASAESLGNPPAGNPPAGSLQTESTSDAPPADTPGATTSPAGAVGGDEPSVERAAAESEVAPATGTRADVTPAVTAPEAAPGAVALPPAPRLFGPGDVDGGRDRARADALLAAAEDTPAHTRLRYLHAAARADRRNPHVAEALARHFLDTHGPSAAEPWAREAVRLRRRRGRYRVLLGDVLRAGGDLPGARRAYEEAAELGEASGRARLSELDR